MEGWVDLGALIMPRPEIEPTTAWSAVPPPAELLRQVTRDNGHHTSTVPYQGDNIHSQLLKTLRGTLPSAAAAVVN